MRSTDFENRREKDHNPCWFYIAAGMEPKDNAEQMITVSHTARPYFAFPSGTKRGGEGVLEVINWRLGELQRSAERLVKAGSVLNLDADVSKRRTKPLHFGKAERLQLTQVLE